MWKTHNHWSATSEQPSKMSYFSPHRFSPHRSRRWNLHLLEIIPKYNYCTLVKFHLIVTKALGIKLKIVVTDKEKLLMWKVYQLVPRSMTIFSNGPSFKLLLCDSSVSCFISSFAFVILFKRLFQKDSVYLIIDRTLRLRETIVIRNRNSGNTGRLNRNLYVMLKFTKRPKTPGMTSKKKHCFPWRE